MSEVDGQEELLPGAPVSSLAESDVIASLSAFARSFGTDRDTLRRRLLAAGVEPFAERAGGKLYKLREVFLAWTTGPEGGVDPESLSPFNRRAWYQAELDRLKLQENRRELVPRLEVEQETAAILKIVAEVFDTLPDIVERDCGATPAQLARIEQACDRAREEMYQRLAEPTAEEAAAHEPPSPPAKPTTPREPVTKAVAAAGALDAASVYLLEALAAGPRPAADLIAEAGTRSISETSLRRAKAKHGVVARRAGKGWAWALAGAEDVQDAG